MLYTHDKVFRGDTIGLLKLDHLAHKLGIDGQKVDLVGEALGGLDRGNVGVDQDGIDTLLLECFDGLW